MKKIFSLFIGFIAVFTISSCGSSNGSSNEGANKMFSSIETAKNGLTDVGFISSDEKCMVIFLDGEFAEVDYKEGDEWKEAFKCDVSISMNSNGTVVANLIGKGEFTPDKMTLKDGTTFLNFKMYSFQELREKGISVN